MFGTLNLAKKAIELGTEKFVLISTDKAVNPSNIMGVSKRLSELIVSSLAEESSKCKLCSVRFGNVLNSSGSVIPLFREQISKGGPVTVTHQDVERYFMTVEEASELVIQSASLANRGEIFILDMGAPVKIATIAEKLIKLNGLTIKNTKNPEGDIEITFIGLKPGEKISEDLFYNYKTHPTKHKKIYIAIEEVIHWESIKQIVDELEEICFYSSLNKLKIFLKKEILKYRKKTEVPKIVTPIKLKKTNYNNPSI